jgi:thymidine phosphorylase
LQQYKTKSEDLEKKVIYLASRILILCGAANSMSNAENLVKGQLEN